MLEGVDRKLELGKSSTKTKGEVTFTFLFISFTNFTLYAYTI